MRTDAIIIGGGVAGLSTAAALSENRAVVVLEAEPALGHHASGRSAAHFIQEYGNAVVRALNAASRPHHEAAGVLSHRPILLLGGPEDPAQFETDLAALNAVLIAIPEALDRVPILDPAYLRHAAMIEDAFDLDTDRLLQGFARTARQNGADIRIGSPVTAIAMEGGHWTVQAGDQRCEAPVVVNATGAWADRVAGLAGLPAIGLTPYRRSIARLPAPGGHDVSGWPLLVGAGEAWYAKPDAGAWLVSPAEEARTEPHDAWAEDMTIAEGIARYQPFVLEDVTRVLTTWAGLRTFAPDRTPVIGKDPLAPGFFWCAGQGGYGFQTAPALAEALAAEIEGRPTRLPARVSEALSPARFDRRSGVQTNSGR